MEQQPAALIVYIVDDDESVRRGLTRLMRAAGLIPRPYESPERFLEDVDTLAHGCILLDVTMPRLTGAQVLLKLRENQEPGMPVIAVSARDDDEIRTRTRELGARLFLRKPVDDQALLDAIQWVTGAPGT